MGPNCGPFGAGGALEYGPEMCGDEMCDGAGGTAPSGRRPCLWRLVGPSCPVKWMIRSI